MRRLTAVLLCLIVLAGTIRIANAEVLIREDFDSWTQVPGRGWQSRTAQNAGFLGLIPDGSGGKALRASAGARDASYINRSLGGNHKELYISFRIRVESATPGATWEQWRKDIVLLQLLGEEGGKSEWRTNIFAHIPDHELSLSLFTNYMAIQKPGVSWARGETLDIGFGIKYDRQGFVKFYYGGVQMYEANYDTTAKDKPNSVNHLRIGPHYGAAATLVIDNVIVTTSEKEAGLVAGTQSAPPRVQINVDSGKTLRQTNFDCFGAGIYMTTGSSPYTKLKAATKPLGITSLRWMPVGTYAAQDWDLDIDHAPLYPQPLYYKQRDPALPFGKTGRSFEEHLSYFNDNRQITCVTKIYGAGGSDYKGKTLDGPNGWIQYNLKRGYRDCIYEIANEPEIPYYPLDSYMFTGSDWVKISNGIVDWPQAGPKRVEQSLMQSGSSLKRPGYDYLLPLNNKGAAIYIGTRYRWSACLIDLEKAGRGNARLAWAIWTDKGWETVHPGNKGEQSYLLNEHAPANELNDPRNLTSADGRVFWSDAFYESGGLFDRWKPAALNEITAGSCPSGNSLYYVKVWVKEGSYTGGEPLESFILFHMAPSEYQTVAKSFASIIRRNGGSAYATATSTELHPQWLDMLKSLSPSVDGYAFHGYPAGLPEWDPYQRKPSVYSLCLKPLYDVEWLRKMALELRADKAIAGKKLALTEWGRTDVGYLSGLSCAVGLCEILKGGWDSAQRHTWHTLTSREDPYALICSRSNDKDTEWFERPSGTAFRMVRRAAESSIISAECTIDEKQYPGVYVCAFQGPKPSDKSLILVNRTSIDLPDAPIQWKDAGGLQFRVSTLKSTAGISANNEGGAMRVTEAQLPNIRFSKNGEARLTLPACSLYVLEAVP